MFERKYTTKVGCENCGEYSVIKIPRGVVQKDWIERKQAECKNCGCVILPQVESEDEEEGVKE